jgi:hypothetical protein
MQQQQRLGQRPSSSSSAAECTLYVRSMYRHTDVCERSCQIRAGRFPMFPPALHPCLCDFSFFHFVRRGLILQWACIFRLPSRLSAGHCSIATRELSHRMRRGIAYFQSPALLLTVSTVNPLGPRSAAIKSLGQSSPATTHPSCSHPVSLNPEDPSPSQFAVTSCQSTLPDDSLEITGQQPTVGLGN